MRQFTIHEANASFLLRAKWCLTPVLPSGDRSGFRAKQLTNMLSITNNLYCHLVLMIALASKSIAKRYKRAQLKLARPPLKHITQIMRPGPVAQAGKSRNAPAKYYAKSAER